MSLDPVVIADVAAQLRVLAHPARLRIALHLLEGECAVGQIEAALAIRQPNLSQYLGELREAGLLLARRESRAIFYRVAHGGPERLLASLRQGLGQGAPVLPPSAPLSTPHRRLMPAASFAVVRGAR